MAGRFLPISRAPGPDLNKRPCALGQELTPHAVEGGTGRPPPPRPERRARPISGVEWTNPARPPDLRADAARLRPVLTNTTDLVDGRGSGQDHVVDLRAPQEQRAIVAVVGSSVEERHAPVPGVVVGPGPEPGRHPRHARRVAWRRRRCSAERSRPAPGRTSRMRGAPPAAAPRKKRPRLRGIRQAGVEVAIAARGSS